jgi:hypothetical protein
MPRTILAGLLLVLAAGLTVWLGEGLHLDLESVALLGVAVGGAVALVPHETSVRRLAGFLLGFVAAFVGYLFRAAVTPDTSAGRAIAAALIVLICVGVAAIAANRLPLWAVLLGAASLSGAYEFTYAQAPTRVLSTSVSSATSLLLCAAVGFAVAALSNPTQRETPPPAADDTTPIDTMMETSK